MTKTEYTLSDEFHSLSFGLAYIAFGENAVKAVILDKKWTEKYPEIIHGTELGGTEKYKTILPAEIVYEIAGREDCIFDFVAAPDGKRLYTRYRRWDKPQAIDVDIETQGYVILPNQQALLEYGAFCLFRAADSSYGLKGETGREKSL